MPFGDPALRYCANPVCSHLAAPSSRYCDGCDQILDDLAQEAIDDALWQDYATNYQDDHDDCA